MIEQARNSCAEEAEVLYWILEDAIYENNLSRAKGIYSILLYMAKYRPDIISMGLRDDYRTRLKEIAYELYEDGCYRFRKSINIRQSISPKNIPFKRQTELSKYLKEHPDLLSTVCNEPVIITGTEVEVDHEYKCDIVAESKERFYPIELKIAQSDHQVVSQILKYCFFFYRKLRYSRYKKIQGVVISNGYCAWSVNELRREGIICLDVIPQEIGIRLEKIN